MCTFGEIVEPGSRNTWEDWEENDANQSELKWQNDLEVSDKISTFLIVEGRYLAEGVRKQLDLKLQLVNEVREVNLKLYKNNKSDFYTCVLNEYNLLYSSEIVELLKPFIFISDDITAIQTKPLVEYQVSELSVQNYVIRCLKTSNLGETSSSIQFPKLEQPNIISGVSAGVISLRENLNMSGTAVVGYIQHPEENQIVELQELLQNLNVVQLESKGNNILKSNLYI